MRKNPLDFGNAVPIIASTNGLRFGCLRSGRSNPGPLLLEIGFELEHETSAKEVIMTSKREYHGSQDFSALDIPVT